jgi:hypothetical protein
MNDDSLDSILDIDPASTRSATCSVPDMPAPAGPGTVIEQACAILTGELVADASSNTSLAPAAAVQPLVPVPDKHLDELQEDMEYARTNMKDVIDQSKSAFTSALDMAEQGGEPRAYEVVSQLIAAIVQANKDLISLHKTRKDTLKTDKEVKQVGEASSGTTINNIEKAVFVGRAQDLLRELKQIEKDNV